MAAERKIKKDKEIVLELENQIRGTFVLSLKLTCNIRGNSVPELMLMIIHRDAGVNL